MTALRMDTLRRYGNNEILAATIPDPAAREARLREMAERWAREFDPNSLVTLRKAMIRFDAERDLAKIRARVLYVLSRTDVLFPPSLAPDVMAKLTAAGVDATYVELDSDFGHLASGADCAKWAPALQAFLDRLARQPGASIDAIPTQLLTGPTRGAPPGPRGHVFYVVLRHSLVSLSPCTSALFMLGA